MSFTPTGQGLDIWKDRYARDPGENWYSGAYRLAKAMAAAEKEPYEWEEKFNDIIVSGLFMPGGRIWYGAGRPVQAMLNCFVIPTEDSMAGWGKTVSDLMQITALGGGVGMNLSPVRGKGFSISRGGESTGAVSLGIACNGVGDVLRGGGGRRIAMMQALDVDHPDILDFIEAKVDRKQLNNANISLIIPPHMKTEWFVDRVRRRQEPRAAVPGSDARARSTSAEMWEKVIENAWQNGEPGVLNGYLANQQSNIAYSHPLICTNPCGEIWLPAYGCCCLGALVLPRFVKRFKAYENEPLSSIGRPWPRRSSSRFGSWTTS
jgi:ribonucleoside-diphosphate reductase alpha chain